MRRKNHFVGMNGTGRGSWKGGKSGWEQTKMSLTHQTSKSHKKPGCFHLVVGPCQLTRGLMGATQLYGDSILHCIAINWHLAS